MLWLVPTPYTGGDGDVGQVKSEVWKDKPLLLLIDGTSKETSIDGQKFSPAMD